MSDIITRLLLKTNDFDANLNRAKGSVNSFQGGISSMAKTAGAGIMKFAGTIGIAVGASEAFMKTIRGSQTTSDEFDAQIRTCQTSVNEFFTSLSTGDFTYFLGGLDSIISKSRDAYAALDQLGNARISYDYFREDFNAAMAESRSVAMDSTASKEQREAALKEWTKALEDKKNKASSVSSDALTALKTVLVEGNLLNADDVTLEDFAKVLSYDVAGSKRDVLKSEMANKYDTYKIKYAELERRKKNGGLADWAFPESKEAKDRASLNDFIASKQAELNKEYKDAILFQQAIVKWKDEELIKAVQLGKEYKQINQELANDKKTFDRVRDRINKPKKNPKENEEKKPLKDTLSWYDIQITELNKTLVSSANRQARATIQATINELEQKRISLKMQIDGDVFKGKHGEMKDGELLLPASKVPDIAKIYSDSGTEFAKLESMYSEMIAERQNALSKATDEEQQAFIQSQIGKLKSTLKELRSMQKESDVTGHIYAAYQNNAGSKKQGSFDLRKEIGNMKLPKFESPIKKEDIDLNQQYADSLGDVNNVMGSLSGLFDSNTTSVLQWGSSLIGTIAQAIPKILEMSTANEIEAASATKSASANTLAAGSEALKAHAGIPFVGIAMGVAGVAAIIAAMASIPKFANGGIVPGNSFAGDKVPAMLNSGEMILNGSQQANLFKMLNTGLNISHPNISLPSGHLAGIISPSENDRRIDVSGDWILRGDTIFLQLKNYMKKTGKKL
ncbi:coiled-coil domain-containing protein [Bacteroides fragilis]|uniref:hypothetical protein n=1 Tax=Bacteroides fragilis TaxID=817 RepID=UPI0004458B76|nr:hypothetical protein [Bacteroides fragilis]EXZ03187.1 hypothetical protein M072_4456 [Bacteroides fragilis str. DS-208]